MAKNPQPKLPKFGYRSKKQVKISKPKPPKFGYTSKSQVKITKPNKPQKESLREIARIALFEVQTDKLTVVNPETKNRIKVASALKYPHMHPAFKAAAALLKKINITLPTSIHAVKPDEQIPLSNTKPHEDPSRASVGRAGSAISGDAADKHLTELQSDYINNLEPGSLDGIDTYTGSGYSWINSYLRGDTDRAYSEFTAHERVEDYFEDYVHKTISNLDKAFKDDRSILRDDVLVWRGIGKESGILEELLDGGVGTTISDSGFISTSIHDKVARNFAGHEGTILKIIARKGTKGLYPQAGNMGLKKEYEMILPRDSKLRVIEIVKEKVEAPHGGTEMIERHVIVCETVAGEEQ